MTEADFNLAGTLDKLVRVMKAAWLWPSPEVGFARHVFESAGEAVPATNQADPWPTAEPLHRAPILASAGYMIGGSRSITGMQLDEWAQSLSRLSGREPFRPDRLSFAYMPLETLGISLGVARHPRLNAAARSWMCAIIERLRQDGSTEPWADLLYGAAAQALGVPWRKHLFYRLDGTDTGVLGLLKWLVATRPAATFESLGDETRLDTELLRRAAIEPIQSDNLPRAALSHFAFRRAFEILHAPTSRQGECKNLSIPHEMLRRIPVGATVNFNFYGDHVSEQINLKNSNITGSAIGTGATASIGDINAFQSLVDQSTNLDAELKAKLKQAREAIEQTVLTETDKKDVLDDLGKLTDEMGQKAPEASRVQRLWKRIKEVAPTASAILASAVAISKLIGAAHGVPMP